MQIPLPETLEGTNARRETPLLKSSVTTTGAAAARRVRPQANVVSLTRLQVETYGKYWVDECRGAGHSERTTEYRQDVIVKLCWFLDHREHPWCTHVELKEFLAYLLTGHNEPGFRWGNAKSPNCKKPVRPLTRHRYWRELSAWCKWMVKEGSIASSPMDQVDEPPKPKEQIPHLTQDQVEALFAAALRTKYPRRDIAILMLLLDTGLRASELTGLTFATVDFYAADGGQARVYGKGNKYRVVPFDRETAVVLRAYVRAEIGNLEEIAPATPLFLAERGGASSRPLTRDGLRFLIYRLSDMAGIKRGVIKCSPHVFRHTCAYMALISWGLVPRSLLRNHEREALFPRST